MSIRLQKGFTVSYAMPAGFEFPEVLTLPVLQRHVADLCRHYGWDKKEDEKAFLLFIEEVGELAKAIRKVTGLAEEVNNPDKPIISAEARQQNLAEEFGDVLGYFMELANRFGVDLESAYCAKIAEATQREWL